MPNSDYIYPCWLCGSMWDSRENATECCELDLPGTSPWRVVRPLVIGVLAGLLLILVIDQLPTSAQFPTIMAVVIASFVYLIWMMIDLRRHKQYFDLKMAQMISDLSRFRDPDDHGDNLTP